MKKLPSSGLVTFLSVTAAGMFGAHAAPALGPTGNYYDVIAGPSISWDDANTAANATSYLGFPGHLVTISGAVEDVFIDTLRNSLGFGQVWVGGFQDPITEADPLAGWTWVNGEGTFPGVDSAIPYADWGAGEPNNFGGVLEQHLAIGRFGLGGGWNDEGSAPSLITGYAIEFEASRVPEHGPSSLLIALGVFALVGVHRLTRLESLNSKSCCR
jgi:hypothetical protein